MVTARTPKATLLNLTVYWDERKARAHTRELAEKELAEKKLTAII